MLEPVPTPTFDASRDQALAAFQTLFNRPAYDPQAALAKAQALLPDNLKQDYYWLPLALICANSSLHSLLVSVQRRESYGRIVEHLGLLSGGQYVLAMLGLHLFNEKWELPKDGLLGLRLLDDWHFELAMHAIRIHSRGLR
ncbi:MAG: hypothetical protein HC875_35330 [Anaerolineales bacterium]|nr:hypothetical protein [Anaerolineales bacterium]